MSYPVFRTKPNGVPILSSDEIDLHAETIARELAPEIFSGTPDAPDLRRLLRYLGGWHFAGRYLSRSGTLLGLASFSGGELTVTDRARRALDRLEIPPSTILVDRALFDPGLEAVFRFTLAHECGHALYHRKFCADPANMEAYAAEGKAKHITDSEEEFGKRDQHRIENDHDWVEWQANAFASAFLMPKTPVLRVLELVRADASPGTFLTDLCAMLADVFHVSASAAFYRMRELGIAGPGTEMIRGGIIVRGE